MVSPALLGFLRAYRNSSGGMAGLAVVAGSCALAIFAGYLSPYGPFEQSDQLFLAPCLEHLLGTDNLGRDVLSRMIWGTRVSLLFGFGAAGLSLLIGVVMGSIPAYFGGLVDDLFSRFFEIYQMIPTLFLVIVIVAVFGTNILFSMIVVGLTLWAYNAKIVRAQVLVLKTRAFVQAAIGAGAGHMRVIFRHILPNGIAPVIANSTIMMADAVLLEASLSFLGLGDPNQVSWGQILLVAQDHVGSAWWMALFPGIAIMMLVLAFNLVGDGVNLAMNPRLQWDYQLT